MKYINRNDWYYKGIKIGLGATTDGIWNDHTICQLKTTNLDEENVG